MRRILSRLSVADWIPAAIALAAFAAFLPALHNGLLSWDDGALLLENKAYQGFG